MKRAVYYNMTSNLDYEHELLKKWNIEGLELIEVKGAFSADKLKELEASSLTLEFTNVGAEVFEKNPQLEIIALQSIGYDPIDVASATKHNVCVTNSPGYCAEDAATHAMALFLSVTRQVQLFHTQTVAGSWDCFAGNTMYRLSGKKAGLISFGNIPQKIVPMLKGFGIEVFAFDTYKDADFISERGATKVETLEEILGLCDFIFLHTPLTKETFHLIDENAISKMKDGAVLVNVARGPLVDEVALIKALKSGKLSGLGTDVLEDEKVRTSELLQLPNVTITPHAAYLSADSLKQSREMSLGQVVQRVLKKEVPSLCINRDGVRREEF